MTRFVLVAVAAALLCAAACWPTRVNPRYCDATHPCGDPTTGCDQSTHACMPKGMLDMLAPPDLAPMCTMNAQCAAMPVAPICGKDGVCRACMTGDCSAPTPVCATTGSMTGACVQCAGESDCSATQTVCSPTGSCVACTAHAQCGSGVCEAGQCVAEANIAYVDQGNAGCGTSGMGKRTTPYCQVNDALMATPLLPYVEVIGNANPYKAITVPGTANLTVTIVGPGKTATTKATFSQDNSPSLQVAVSSAGVTVSVVVDGLELSGSNVGSEPGAICSVTSGTASLSVLNSLVDGSRGAGIESTSCTLNVAQNYITANQGGGISVTGGTYDIENNLIYANAATVNAPAVAINSTATGALAFNTIAGNSNAMGVAGITCGNNGVVSNSILALNVGNVANQSSGCTLTSVVTGGTDGATGTFADAPTFKGGGDYHLTNVAANKTCCIDKITPSASTPALDVDGTARPQNALDDIGGHEVVQ